MMSDLVIDLGDARGQAEALRRDGQTVVFVAVDGERDRHHRRRRPDQGTPPRRSGAAREGLEVVMLTGDSRRPRGGRQEAGDRRVEAEVLPDQKAPGSSAEKPKAAIVAMAGDGSTTRPRWRRRTSASRWAPAPTWRWRAQG
jgi:Cu+-exporting ATPase